MKKTHRNKQQKTPQKQHETCVKCDKTIRRTGESSIVALNSRISDTLDENDW